MKFNFFEKSIFAYLAENKKHIMFQFFNSKPLRKSQSDFRLFAIIKFPKKCQRVTGNKIGSVG